MQNEDKLKVSSISSPLINRTKMICYKSTSIKSNHSEEIHSNSKYHRLANLVIATPNLQDFDIDNKYLKNVMKEISYVFL